MNENEKGAGGTTPQRDANNPIVQRIPPGRKLPAWDPPVSSTQAMSRLKRTMTAFASHVYDNLFKWGGDLTGLKNSPSVHHGEWLGCLAELGINQRTAQNWMRFHRECLEFKRMVVPHWVRDRKDRTKNETVALLAEGPETEQEKPEKRKHEPGASKEWSATDCARSLLDHYERLVSHRSEEERRDVRTAFNEVADDADDDFAESRRLIREGGGKLIEEEE